MSIDAHFIRLAPYELDELLDQEATEDSLEAVWKFIESVRDTERGGPSPTFHLGREWELLQALLSGQICAGPPPLGNAITGGRPLGSDEVRYLYSSEVSEVADALAALDDEALFANIDRQMLVREGIDPTIIQDEDDAEPFRSDFYALKKFYRLSSASGDAMLLYLA